MKGLVFFFILTDLKNKHGIDSIICDVFSQRNFIVNSIIVKKTAHDFGVGLPLSKLSRCCLCLINLSFDPKHPHFHLFFFQRQQTNKVRHSISNLLEQSDPDIDTG